MLVELQGMLDRQLAVVVSISSSSGRLITIKSWNLMARSMGLFQKSLEDTPLYQLLPAQELVEVWKRGVLFQRATESAEFALSIIAAEL